jgi:putative ABC transport system ATP-binding protein
MNTLIELSDVQRWYHTGDEPVRALDGIDLTIDSGEYVAITGASGSGKSTLLNVLGGLDRPSRGRYRLGGTELALLDDTEISRVRNRDIGIVFQSFHLLPRLTVLENVLLPLRFAPPELDLEARARELLVRVNLSERSNHRPSELSGGQMQRAAIARALLMQPKLLLADEPTGNLDSRSAEQVLALIAEVHAQGQTVVLVTHDPDIARAAPRHVRLRDGRIEEDARRDA